MNWYLAEVHANREAIVAYTMRCLGIEPFLPLILRMERISTRTKRLELAAVPALQGYLFFRTEPEWITDVDAIRDVKGIFKASDKLAYATIPDREMQSFILAHDKWHEQALKAHMCRREIRPANKPKFKAMTEDTLKEIMATLFPAEAMDLAEVA